MSHNKYFLAIVGIVASVGLLANASGCSAQSAPTPGTPGSVEQPQEAKQSERNTDPRKGPVVILEQNSDYNNMQAFKFCEGSTLYVVFYHHFNEVPADTIQNLDSLECTE